MSRPFIDTNILVRFIAGDHPQLQTATAALLETIERGELEVQCPSTVIADAVYVLSSKANHDLERQEVSDTLSAIVRLPKLVIEDRAQVLGALVIFAQTSLDFGDAMILAGMHLQGKTILYSYDHDFDRFRDIQRLEPSPEGLAQAA